MKSPLSLMPGFTHAPGGLSVSELLARHPDLSRRTAQRQLAWLVDQGHLVARGQARARRYHAAVAPTGRQTTPLVVAEPGATPSPAVPDERSPDPLPLSPDSRDIVAHVTQPLSRRTPVGYQWDLTLTTANANLEREIADLHEQNQALLIQNTDLTEKNSLAISRAEVIQNWLAKIDQAG